MKIKNMMIATIGTVLLLSVGCTSKSVQTTERVPAQQGLGTGNIGSSNVYDDNERLNTLFVVEAVRCQSTKLASSADFIHSDSPMKNNLRYEGYTEPRAFDYEDRCYDKNNIMVYKQAIIQKKPVTRRQDKNGNPLYGGTITYEFFDSKGKLVETVLNTYEGESNGEYKHSHSNLRIQNSFRGIHFGLASAEYPTQLSLITVDTGRNPVYLRMVTKNNSPGVRIDKMVNDDYESIVKAAAEQLYRESDILPVRAFNGKEYYSDVLEEAATRYLVMQQSGNRPVLPIKARNEIEKKSLCTGVSTSFFNKYSCTEWTDAERVDDHRAYYYARLILNSRALDVPGAQMAYKFIDGDKIEFNSTNTVVSAHADINYPAFIIDNKTGPINLFSFYVKYVVKNEDIISTKMDFKIDGDVVRVTRVNIETRPSKASFNMVKFFDFLKNKFGTDIVIDSGRFYK